MRNTSVPMCLEVEYYDLPSAFIHTVHMVRTNALNSDADIAQCSVAPVVGSVAWRSQRARMRKTFYFRVRIIKSVNSPINRM